MRTRLRTLIRRIEVQQCFSEKKTRPDFTTPNEKKNPAWAMG